MCDTAIYNPNHVLSSNIMQPKDETIKIRKKYLDIVPTLTEIHGTLFA